MAFAREPGVFPPFVFVTEMTAAVSDCNENIAAIAKTLRCLIKTPLKNLFFGLLYHRKKRRVNKTN
jgi:hypothetical protein